MGLMDGKKGLILNIANDRSIATHIANNVIKQGATCGFGFLPMDNIEKSQRRVKKAMEENGIGRPSTYASIIETIVKATYSFITL